MYVARDFLCSGNNDCVNMAYMQNKSILENIAPQIAKEKIENGALLLDVRESDEVNNLSCDISNTIFMPTSELQNKYKELPKDSEIIVMCYSGGRSQRVAEFLISQGYEKVFNLSGGISNWESEGLPTK